MNIGIIVRADKTGLGNQTRNLVKLLKPNKILVIDSTNFNGNKQYFEPFQTGYDVIFSDGFMDNNDMKKFLYKLDVVITCELFYNPVFIQHANRVGIRTYNQYNYEFLDNLRDDLLPLPTKLLSPSYWHLEEMQKRYPNRVVYLPPPTDESQFLEVRNENFARKGKPRFLHIVGRQAAEDRNGTLDLLEALKYTKSNFELVLKVQTASPLIEQYKSDKRITIDYDSPENEEELYKGFDAMILPRRYAGLCLPMNEALMSGLPVIMTDVEPNNRVLPEEWLVESEQDGTIHTRVELPLYSAKPIKLAEKIDWLVKTDLNKTKVQAFNIGFDNYSFAALRDKYYEEIK